MTNYLVIATFIIATAVASGSVLISYQLKNKYNKAFLGSLMYMQVFMFTFGFYAFWGQILVKALLSEYVSPDLMLRIRNILIYLGIPFLVFGWYMLIRFSCELNGIKSMTRLLIGYAITNLLILLLIGYLIYSEVEPHSFTVIKYYYIVLNLVYTSTAALIFLLGKSKYYLARFSARLIATILLALAVTEGLLIQFYNENNLIVTLAFILTYFIADGFLSIYIRYFANLKYEPTQRDTLITLDEFCSKFEITNREREVIVEIYNGLTNQQIANKLLISLQTVKDHTSRIYSKTNTQSRVQLIKILQKPNT